MSTLSVNPIKAMWFVLKATRVRRPGPFGSGTIDHSGFKPVLDAIAAEGPNGLDKVRTELGDYRTLLRAVDPNRLSRDEALAFWINFYNAEALALVCEALDLEARSVLHVSRGFERARTTIAGEQLSLYDVEHGKIRRFADPRIHTALVCGSVSCPTLRFEPFHGTRLEGQLDEQMRSFLAAGGSVPDREGNRIRLSRIFLWYGSDFVRPDRMPTWLPATRRSVARSLLRWLPEDTADWVRESKPKVEFQPYDWVLGCSIG